MFGWYLPFIQILNPRSNLRRNGRAKSFCHGGGGALDPELAAAIGGGRIIERREEGTQTDDEGLFEKE
jgi:hypothetical protein